MVEIDPNYDTYATVAWGYNAPFIRIQEPGENGIWLSRSAAARLLDVLPQLIVALDEELGTI